MCLVMDGGMSIGSSPNKTSVHPHTMGQVKYWAYQTVLGPGCAVPGPGARHPGPARSLLVMGRAGPNRWLTSWAVLSRGRPARLTSLTETTLR